MTLLEISDHRHASPEKTKKLFCITDCRASQLGIMPTAGSFGYKGHY